MELLLLEDSQMGEYYVFSTEFAVWAAAPGDGRGIDFLRSFRLRESESWIAIKSLRGDAELFYRVCYQMKKATDEDVSRLFDAVAAARLAEAARRARNDMHQQFLDNYTILATPGVLVEDILVAMGCNLAQARTIMLAAEYLEGGYRGHYSINRKEGRLMDLKTRKDLFVSYVALFDM